MCHRGNTGMERTLNKSQHRKFIFNYVIATIMSSTTLVNTREKNKIFKFTQEKKKKSDLVASVVEIQEQVGLWHNLMEMPPTFHTISDRTVALSQMAFLMIQVSIFPQEYQATVKCEYTNNFI